MSTSKRDIRIKVSIKAAVPAGSNLKQDHSLFFPVSNEKSNGLKSAIQEAQTAMNALLSPWKEALDEKQVEAEAELAAKERAKQIVKEPAEDSDEDEEDLNGDA